MDFQIKYLEWKTKVDSYVKYLTNIEYYEIDNIKQFYNSGFEDKVVSLIISKNISPKKNYTEEEWMNDIQKVFCIFDININQDIQNKILKKHFPNNPFNVSCSLLKNYGYLSLSLFYGDENTESKNSTIFL